MLYQDAVGSPTANISKFATKIQNFGELTAIHSHFCFNPYCLIL